MKKIIETVRILNGKFKLNKIADNTAKAQPTKRASGL